MPTHENQTIKPENENIIYYICILYIYYIMYNINILYIKYIKYITYILYYNLKLLYIL